MQLRLNLSITIPSNYKTSLSSGLPKHNHAQKPLIYSLLISLGQPPKGHLGFGV